MATFYNPKIVTDSLRAGFDVGNLKSYPGSGNTFVSINGRENATSSNIVTANDANAMTVLNYNSSSEVTINLSPVVNHEVWSYMLWIRSTGTTSSNYRGVLRLEQTGGPGYFYILDTREVATSYLLGYQKDYNINDWLVTQFNTTAQWAEQKWWCIGASHNNTVFKSYRQGNLFSTQTQTRNVADYTDLTQLKINHSNGNTVYLSSFLFYDKVLSDDEFKQNFNATRGRFGL